MLCWGAVLTKQRERWTIIYWLRMSLMPYLIHPIKTIQVRKKWGHSKSKCSIGISESCRLPGVKMIFAMEYNDRKLSKTKVCAKFSSYCKIIFTISCILSSVSWDTFLWMTLYQSWIFHESSWISCFEQWMIKSSSTCNSSLYQSTQSQWQFKILALLKKKLINIVHSLI